MISTGTINGRVVLMLTVSLLLVVLGGSKLAESQRTEQQQQIVTDDANNCPANTGNPAPLNIIKPQVYYFKVGGGVGTTNGEANKYKYVFNYGYDDDEFQQAKIDPSLPTKAMVHGFQQSFNGTDRAQFQSMIDSINRSPSTTYNVFVLNWPNKYFSDRDGFLKGYETVASSTRAVGNYLGQFLKRMQDTIGLDLVRTQLIGFSFGGQVVGFTGKYLKGEETTGTLGRITGFDPAAPCFEDVPSTERLSPGDAIYVDVIHTNRGGFGTSLRSGNRDVIVNDGRVQPGCSPTDSYCNHLRVFALFNYPPNPLCLMVAYQCAHYEAFSQGNCETCPNDEENSCNLVNFPLNFGADEYQNGVMNELSVIPRVSTDKTQNLRYFVKTGDTKRSPACLQHYQVKILSTSGANITQLTLTSSQDGQIYKLTPTRQNNQLFTALLTYDGAPTRFDAAHARTVDIGSDETCGPLYATVAFMSQLDAKSRSSQSSYLCSTPEANNQLGVCTDKSDKEIQSLLQEHNNTSGR